MLMIIALAFPIHVKVFILENFVSNARAIILAQGV